MHQSAVFDNAAIYRAFNTLQNPWCISNAVCDLSYILLQIRMVQDTHFSIRSCNMRKTSDLETR